MIRSMLQPAGVAVCLQAIAAHRLRSFRGFLPDNLYSSFVSYEFSYVSFLGVSTPRRGRAFRCNSSPLIASRLRDFHCIPSRKFNSQYAYRYNIAILIYNFLGPKRRLWWFLSPHRRSTLQFQHDPYHLLAHWH